MGVMELWETATIFVVAAVPVQISGLVFLSHNKWLNIYLEG